MNSRIPPKLKNQNFWSSLCDPPQPHPLPPLGEMPPWVLCFLLPGFSNPFSTPARKTKGCTAWVWGALDPVQVDPCRHSASLLSPLPWSPRRPHTLRFTHFRGCVSPTVWTCHTWFVHSTMPGHLQNYITAMMMILAHASCLRLPAGAQGGPGVVPGPFTSCTHSVLVHVGHDGKGRTSPAGIHISTVLSFP